MTAVRHLWLVARAFWHDSMSHHVYDTRSAGNLVSIASCTCGGYTQRRWDGRDWQIELSTCPRVLLDQKQGTPAARVVRR